MAPDLRAGLGWGKGRGGAPAERDKGQGREEREEKEELRTLQRQCSQVPSQWWRLQAQLLEALALQAAPSPSRQRERPNLWAPLLRAALHRRRAECQLTQERCSLISHGPARSWEAEGAADSGEPVLNKLDVNLLLPHKALCCSQFGLGSFEPLHSASLFEQLPRPLPISLSPLPGSSCEDDLQVLELRVGWQRTCCCCCCCLLCWLLRARPMSEGSQLQQFSAHTVSLHG